MDFKKTCRATFRFLSKNKLMLVQLGVMGVVVATGDTSFASTKLGQENSGFSVVLKPIQNIQNAITGPIATAIGTAGAGLLGLSVAMNFENSIAKRAIQGAGGVGLGLGAATAISSLGSGMLFF